MKRSQYFALGILILLTLVLLNLPSRTAAQFKLAISGIFIPLFGLAGSSQRLTEKAGSTVVPRQELLRQLEQLRKDRQELDIRTAQHDELARENNRLRQHLGLPKQYPWKLVLARVVARDPANWWRTLRIDAGLRDGVVTSSPVLTAEGLVGRVSEVGYGQSQVVLLGNPDCRVFALVEETRDQGVIAPSSSSPLDNVIVDLGFLSRNSKLSSGQRVVTSGLGGVFPKGILIGQIVDSRPVEFGLYGEARVALAVKMNALEEVWVKVP